MVGGRGADGRGVVVVVEGKAVVGMLPTRVVGCARCSADELGVVGDVSQMQPGAVGSGARCSCVVFAGFGEIVMKRRIVRAATSRWEKMSVADDTEMVR